MSKLSREILFTESQYWVEKYSDLLVVGLTDEYQEAISDIINVKLPNVEKVYQIGEPCGMIESSSVEEDIYAPVTGRILEVNSALEETPEIVNESPLDEGWLFKMSPLDLSELDNLMSEEEYQEFLEEN